MPTDVKTRARQAGARNATTAVPGLGMAAFAAGLSALGFGYWAQASRGAAADVARMAEVAPQDMQEALATVEGTPARMALFKDPMACSARLAWVVVKRDRGQPAGRIRLQSGSYFSPSFELTEVPVRSPGQRYSLRGMTRGRVLVDGVTASRSCPPAARSALATARN